MYDDHLVEVPLRLLPARVLEAARVPALLKVRLEAKGRLGSLPKALATPPVEAVAVNASARQACRPDLAIYSNNTQTCDPRLKQHSNNIQITFKQHSNNTQTISP